MHWLLPCLPHSFLFFLCLPSFCFCHLCFPLLAFKFSHISHLETNRRKTSWASAQKLSPSQASLSEFSLCLLSLPLLTSVFSCPALWSPWSCFPGAAGLPRSVAFNTYPSQHSSPLALSPSAFQSVSTPLESLNLFSLARSPFLRSISIGVPQGPYILSAVVSRSYCPVLLVRPSGLTKMRSEMVQNICTQIPYSQRFLHQELSTSTSLPEFCFSS